MAIKKGNVRLQVTVSEQTMRDLDELCERESMSRSRAVAYAIFAALVDSRVEAVYEEMEGKEGEQK